jgi:YVTN family beta-propeller protein
MRRSTSCRSRPEPGVTSDQKILVANSRQNTALYKYSLPDLQLLGTAPLGGKGAEWLTITPDDKTVYVANAHTNDVSVVDIASMKEIARIPVGFAPARNTPWIAP